MPDYTCENIFQGEGSPRPEEFTKLYISIIKEIESREAINDLQDSQSEI